MSIPFFSKYSTIPYDLYGDGSVTNLTNITQEVSVTASKLPDDASVYTYYSIRDGDRPDTVSYDLYGTPDYYWTFFILNSFLKDGINDAWPMSYYDFTSMIESEYSPYSVITFRPESLIDIKTKDNLMDFSLTPLDSKYLPYLRLNDDIGNSAKILKFDSVRQQLIIYNISSNSRDSFISSPHYSLSWYEPNVDNSFLKLEWLSIMKSMYVPNGLKESAWKTIIETGTNINDTIFNQVYIPVSITSQINNKPVISYPYNWSLYYNAAHTYYDNTGNIRNVYDLIKSGTIEPIYKSFQDIESIANDAKTQIKIIREDRIADFASAYFSVLNS